MANTGVVKLDWSAAQGKGFEPLEPGEYHATLTSVELNKGKVSNEPKYEWIFTITEQGANNRKFWHHTSLQPKAMFSLFNTLTGLGMEPEQVMEYADPDALLGAIRTKYVGKRVLLTLSKSNRTDGAGMTNSLVSIELLDSVGEALSAEDEEARLFS